MSSVVSSVRLHLNKREDTFLVPLYITATVAVVSVVIALLFWRSGSVPRTTEWIEGSRGNPGIAFALAGFLVYQGVQSVAMTFPFALTLGATRRSFVAGTLLWAVVTSAYLALVFAALLAVELATDHWFVGFHIVNVNVLGAGDVTTLVSTVFLGSLALFAIGGAFAASWVRYGPRGPQLVGLAAGLLLAAAIALALPSAAAILAAFEPWWLAVAVVGVIGVCGVGTWLLLRGAAVR